MEYIINYPKNNGCVFCSELAKADSPENLIVYRGINAFVILNRFPYTSGHLMIVPYQHQPSLEKLDSETRSALMELSSMALEILRDEYNAQGFNIGVNIGEAAGAGIIEHVHLHIVPRWGGDTNFMSTLANTRVIPEGLDQTYWRIRRAWEQKINS
jgi:ATP adenylyltransferase